MKILLKLMFFASFAVMVGGLFAGESVRTWQTKSGSTLDAVWDIAADTGGDEIVVVWEGKKYEVRLEDLSDDDVKYVQGRRQAAGAEVPPEFKLVDEQPVAEPVAEEVASTAPAIQPTAEESAEPAKENETLKIRGVDYTFCWCPAGTFKMGSPELEKGRQGDEVLHEVTLSQGFWMLETEVTQQMWKSVMGDNPSLFKGDNLPVENVSWNDCQKFIEKLNKEKCIPAGYKVSLPTEAQWEYACRAGTETPFSFGDTLNGDQANCDGNYPYGTETKGKNLESTAAVKSYAPNAWGLYDMHGNVYEWCSDWYDDNYYRVSPKTDPVGPDSGSFRVIRGGCWSFDAWRCRSAYRDGYVLALRIRNLGFRLALVPIK